MRLVVLATCLSLSCSSFLPTPASPSARPARLLDSARAQFTQGELHTALELTKEAEREAVGFDDRETEVAAVLARAGMYRWLAEEDSAKSLAHRVIDLARTGGFPCLEAEATMILRAMDRHEESPPPAHPPQCTNRAVRARLRLSTARAALAVGDTETAARHLGRSRNIPRVARAEIAQERRFLTAWLRSQQGRHREAVKLAGQVLQKDRASGVKTAIVDDLLLLARIHRTAGDASAAQAVVDRAIKVLETMRPANLVARRLRHASELRGTSRP